MALQLDLLTRVRNIHWAGDGLAVEFFSAPGPSFLKLPVGFTPNPTKATISIWFRIPQATYDAVIAQTPSPVVFPRPPSFFWGSVPIVTFGPTNLKSGDITTSSSWIGVAYNNAYMADGSANPSSDWGTGTGFGLAFNLQYETTGSCPEDYRSDFPENIFMGIIYIGNSVFYAPRIVPVSANRWHHLLISWDISTPMSTHPAYSAADAAPDLSPGIEGAATIYIALDDANVTGLKEFWPCGGYKGGNGFITQSAYNVAQENTEHDPQPSFSWAPTPLPISGDPLGLPTAGLVEFNPHVELAEFQFFTGVTINTGIVANRRAFVDKDGKPVAPDKKPTEDDPREGSISFMGKKPDLLLHNSSNWKKGHNTGSFGVDADGNDIPAGQFTPTGRIDSYTPDPSLHGPQGTAMAASNPARKTNARL